MFIRRLFTLIILFASYQVLAQEGYTFEQILGKYQGSYIVPHTHAQEHNEEYVILRADSSIELSVQEYGEPIPLKKFGTFRYEGDTIYVTWEYCMHDTMRYRPDYFSYPKSRRITGEFRFYLEDVRRVYGLSYMKLCSKEHERVRQHHCLSKWNSRK